MYEYKTLRVWERSFALSVAIDHELRRRRGPPGLSAQLARSAGSVPTNIAEGSGYPTAAQSAKFVDIAIGSACESENHIARAAACGMIARPTAEHFTNELEIILKMLVGFRKWLLRDESMIGAYPGKDSVRE